MIITEKYVELVGAHTLNAIISFNSCPFKETIEYVLVRRANIGGRLLRLGQMEVRVLESSWCAKSTGALCRWEYMAYTHTARAHGCAKRQVVQVSSSLLP